MLLLKHISTLCRLPIGAMTGLSALTGCLLASSRSVPYAVAVGFSVFILSSGASALNQIQERDIDGRMDRTRRRPLPAGMISLNQAIMIALLLVSSGLVLLSSTGTKPLVLGALAIAWYNGVYTPLKRITAFAAIPGAW